MNILIVSQTYKDSYPPKYLSMGSAVKQSENLSKNNQILVLTSGRSKPIDKVSDSLTVISTSGWLLPDPINYVISFQLLFRFISLVRGFKPDVVLVSKFMFFSSFVIPIAKIMQIPVVTATDTYPGINWFPRNHVVSFVMSIYVHLIGLPLLWLSDKVIIFHEGLIEIAKKYHLNYQLIHNGVSPKLLRLLPLPSDIQKPPGEIWIGFVGRFESVKGFKLALLISQKFLRNKKIKFVFVGGSAPEKIYDNCLFLGFRYDIDQIYQLFDLLIAPSFSEGLPNVVMEAMAQKVCVLANGVGGVNSLIKHYKNGYLLDNNSLESFQSAIDYLMSHPVLRRKLSLNARRTILLNYNWKLINLQYQKIFENVRTK